MCWWLSLTARRKSASEARKRRIGPKKCWGVVACVPPPHKSERHTKLFWALCQLKMCIEPEREVDGRALSDRVWGKVGCVLPRDKKAEWLRQG